MTDSVTGLPPASVRNANSRIEFRVTLHCMGSSDDLQSVWEEMTAEEYRCSGINIDATMSIASAMSLRLGVHLNGGVFTGAFHADDPEARKSFREAVERVLKATLQRFDSDDCLAKWAFNGAGCDMSGSFKAVKC